MPLIFALFLLPFSIQVQPAGMKPTELEMIAEINKLRGDPSSYLKDVEPLLKDATARLKEYGKGSKNFSVTFTTVYENGKTVKTTDTTWHYSTEEEVRALTTLVSDLKSLKPLSILKPDNGIYLAAMKHARDQNAHNWNLMHTGSDGSMPWDRIKKFAPRMATGNENLAGRYPAATPRTIVLQLLIDEGIPGYGHRYNLLNPEWTHVACVDGGLHAGMYQWIQNFGKIRDN
jgi:uncharacterized protein YkwD